MSEVPSQPSNPEAADEAGARVDLNEDEAVALSEIAASYARAVPPGREQPYLDLIEAAGTGTVLGEQAATLERVCALALETGQARRIGLAETETLLVNVYRRTAGGRARMAEVKQINEALGHLRDKQLQTVRVAWQRPGRYTVTVGVQGFDLSLAIGPDGLQISSLTTS